MVKREVAKRVSQPVHIVSHLATRGAGLRVGPIANWVVTVFLFVVPVARSWNLLESGRWLGVWGLVYLVNEAWERIISGTYVQRVARKYTRVNSSVAGAIDTLAMKLMNSHDRKLGEEECRGLAVALLHRIRDLVQQTLNIDDEIRIRTTLAVPVGPAGSPFKAIRVWCYDETHDDRRFTEFPLRLPDGKVLPGAPLAFVSGKVQIIDDVRTIEWVPDAGERAYRSIVSIPVKAGGPNGNVIAVLNVDATTPQLFSAESVRDAMLPMVAPALNLVSLVLLMRRKEEPYAFGC